VVRQVQARALTGQAHEQLVIAAIPHVRIEQPGSGQVLAAHHDRGRLDDAAFEQVGRQIERLIERDRRHFGVAQRAIRTSAQRASGYQNHLWKAAHGFELQHDRVGAPLVVGVEKRDELVRPDPNGRVAGGGDARVALTDVGDRVAEAPGQPRRFVRAAVVNHYQVTVVRGGLVEHALDGASERVGPVVCGQHDRNAAVAGKGDAAHTRPSGGVAPASCR
jgi:hypothetical protein